METFILLFIAFVKFFVFGMAVGGPEPVPATDWIGHYSISVAGEMTTTGESNTTWNIRVNGRYADVTSTTYHEPIVCNGQYIAVVANEMVELNYNGDDPNCKQQSPNFIIKQVDGKFYIKGPFGEANHDQWLECSFKAD